MQYQSNQPLGMQKQQGCGGCLTRFLAFVFIVCLLLYSFVRFALPGILSEVILNNEDRSSESFFDPDAVSDTDINFVASFIDKANDSNMHHIFQRVRENSTTNGYEIAKIAFAVFQISNTNHPMAIKMASTFSYNRYRELEDGYTNNQLWISLFGDLLRNTAADTLKLIQEKRMKTQSISNVNEKTNKDTIEK